MDATHKLRVHPNSISLGLFRLRILIYIKKLIKIVIDIRYEIIILKYNEFSVKNLKDQNHQI